MAETPLRDAVRQLEERSGARILIGPETGGRVTMTLNDVITDAAVKGLAVASGNRWSKLSLPAESAKAITPEQAVALVTAAETLAASDVTVQPGDGPVVTVGTPAAPPATHATLYLVHTKADPAAIRAAREAARQEREQKAEEARKQGIASTLSEDARQDPKVVGAYSALQSLSPDQVAVLTREYMLKSTPEQRQAIGEAFARQREQFRDAARDPQSQ